MAMGWKAKGSLAIALVVAVTAAPARAGDVSSDIKKAGKSIGKAAKKFGKEVADATEKGAETAWYKSRDWATRESKRVADATVRFWDDAIRGK